MTTNKQEHFYALDSLRGLAAICVIFSHVLVVYFIEAHSGIDDGAASSIALAIFNSPFSFFYRGSFAVVLFFVLSGYVLTRGCIRNASRDPNYVSAATAKRYLRLGLPVGAAIVLCYIGIAAGVFPALPDGVTAPLLDFPRPGIGFSDMVKSAVYDAMLFQNGSLSYVLWTISVEFYGSLAVFAAYALLGRNPRVHKNACILAGLYLMTQPTGAVFYGFFFIGAAIAQVDFEGFTAKWRPNARLTAGLVLSALGCYLAGFYVNSASYSWLAPLTHAARDVAPHMEPLRVMNGIAAAILMLAVLLSSGPGQISSVLNCKPLLLLGRLSFGIYLLHPLILASVGKHVYLALGKNYTSLAVCLMLVATLTIGAAHFFYSYIDQPSIKIAERFGRWLYPSTQGDRYSTAAGRGSVINQR